MIYDYKITTGPGEVLDLADYKGKVILIVNTATGCGFTSQYSELAQWYNEYHEKGLEIVDIPCNQFGSQAPGSDEEIHTFCTSSYSTTFPQMTKSDVNGDRQIPLYKFLKAQKGAEGDIRWNFTKFVIDRKGDVVKRFEPAGSMDELESLIKSLL